MTQGYAKHRSDTPVSFSDSPSVDAFGRVRVATPSYVFDSQLTYNLLTLIYEQVTLNGGATITHDATNRSGNMAFAATTTGGKAFMQTFEHFRYQPGRSHGIFVTFNFIETMADTLKFAGYSDGANGIELQQSGSTVQIALLSDTTLGDQIVTKANWNLDKLDGTGPSGIILDLTKVQILVIAFQALYSGRVQVGFDIGGEVVFAHEFDHANNVTYPFIQTANLPIRCGMTCTGTVTTTMRFICASVTSSGGQEDLSGFPFSAQGAVTASSGARTHILSVRPKTTFNSIANRIKFVLESIDVLVTGNSPILWELCIGQAISGTTTFNDVNATYSSFEYNTAGTISGSPAMVLQAGYIAASATTNRSQNYRIANRIPITLDAAGVVRILGTLSLIVTGVGATSACQVTMNWKEIR